MQFINDIRHLSVRCKLKPHQTGENYGVYPYDDPGPRATALQARMRSNLIIENLSVRMTTALQ